MDKHSTNTRREQDAASQREFKNPRKQEFILVNHGYVIGPRDASLKPQYKGAFMVTDPLDDEDGYAIFGEDRDELITEAFNHLFSDKDWFPHQQLPSHSEENVCI